MSVFGKTKKVGNYWRACGVRCDGCGKISKSRDGEYTTDGIHAKYINSHGRNCEHDFCEECEQKLADGACSKCGTKPE